MKRNDRRRWLTALVATIAMAVCAIAVGAASPRSAHAIGSPARAKSSARSTPPAKPLVRSTLAAELKALYSARNTSGEQLKELTHTPGMPACKAPPLPTPTQPPGQSYGVPFLAAITDGQILAGYDEWTANHNIWKVKSTTYHLYPWQSKIFNITGWVTGLLQLPSLNAKVVPQDVVFCDNGGRRCVADNPPPAGECIDLTSQFAPSPGSTTPPPPTNNFPPPGSKCWSGADCLPIVLSLTPSGDTSLTVTGVEPDGALDLQVTTSAVTTATEIPPPPSKTKFVCSDAATSITLSTKAPTSLPATAPIPPKPPNRDDRSLRTRPQPLTGPLATARSTLASNDFAVQAFVPSSSSSSPCYKADAGALPFLLNTYAGGWGPTFDDQNCGLYYLVNGKCPETDSSTNPIVAEKGWSQFTATTTVVTLGLPPGPPANFHL